MADHPNELDIINPTYVGMNRDTTGTPTLLFH